MQGKDWWRETAARRPNLLKRTRLVAGLRELFRHLEFVEVETPALQPTPGQEPHIRPIAATLSEPFGQASRRLFLHTSPEFAMRKLLAGGGEERIFQIARCWRDGERSPLHLPEFTMLEWYRAGEDYAALMLDCSYVLRVAAQMTEVPALRHGTMSCDPSAQPEWLTVAEAFRRHAGIDLMTVLDREGLAAELRRMNLHVGDNDGWDDLFHRVMLERIEPRLGDGRATILSDYPLAVGAYARQTPRDPRLCERFELYACGIELANGCTEIADPGELRRRFEADAATARRLYGEAPPLDEALLAALTDSAGIALGVDRLAMLATGADSIDEVVWAPVGG